MSTKEQVISATGAVYFLYWLTTVLASLSVPVPSVVVPSIHSHL